MDAEIAKIYGNKVRVRVCGLCQADGRLLLVNHKGLTSGDFWAPPGGGVEFGDSMHETLVREFREETGLEVTAGNFLFGCEFIKPPLHSLELFFETTVLAGTAKPGYDPELQIIADARFFSAEDIYNIRPEHRHGLFNLVTNLDAIDQLRGFYRI